MRTIAELNQPTVYSLKFIERYQKENPNFAIRFVNPTLLATFAIRDEKELDFFTEVAKGMACKRILYTNNLRLIRVIKDYFELRWKTAMTEYTKKETQENLLY